MVGVQIESFAANTLEFLRREHELLTRGIQPPEMDTEMNGRHVLVVVRGYHYREDLAALRPYIREYKPVMVAVDGGADALIEAGYQPDAILGDMDSVSDEALCCGAELVVHAYPDARTFLQDVKCIGAAVPPEGSGRYSAGRLRGLMRALEEAGAPGLPISYHVLTAALRRGGAE